MQHRNTSICFHIILHLLSSFISITPTNSYRALLSPKISDSFLMQSGISHEPSHSANPRPWPSSHRGSLTSLYIDHTPGAALFIISPNWKPRCSLTGVWLNTEWSIYTPWNTTQQFGWISKEVMVNEKSQSQEVIYYMIPFI